MYLACIGFIDSIKFASLRWHSPMLDGIASVKTWSNVHSGMLKMYCGQVLGKLPVVQRFHFGSLLPFTGTPVAGYASRNGNAAGEVNGGNGVVQHENHTHVAIAVDSRYPR